MIKGSLDKSDVNPLWGGRFDEGASDLMVAINASIDIDQKLYAQDIKASLAHSAMLEQSGIINAQDSLAIKQGLLEIASEIAAGKFEFSRVFEDIHMNIEQGLTQKIGDVAGRLHTARSRNDQVATDFRLYIRDMIDQTDLFYQDLLEALLDQADAGFDLPMPGFTHLQSAQPVTFGHHLMAYVEMFSRDRERFSDCRKRVNQSPLGAGALAGTSFPIDRELTAEILGFAMVMRNSLDAVSARDFALEFLSNASIAAMHLSRLAEELVLWSCAQFAFIELPNSFTSGSSIMPQKKNPDAAELIRAKSGRILGSFITLMHVMKALPLAYSKDMQEDKPPVFDTVESLHLMLRALRGMIAGLKPNGKNMGKALQQGFPTATDMADWLVQKLNIPFRQAHHITGVAVLEAETLGVGLAELSLAQLQKLHSGITAEIYDVLSIENSLQTRTSFGGTAPKNVKQAIRQARKDLAK